MYDVDLFDTPQATIDQLHADGRIVICYFSAGSYEDWRPDAAQFPRSVLGHSLDDWPGERWLDIRGLDLLGPLIANRLDLAASKRCDGVEPDNVDGFENQTGFHLTRPISPRNNRWPAAEAHQRGLSIGLKNDLNQVPELVEDYDWALNEQCFAFDECDLLRSFIQAGKAVFGVEYDGNPEAFCPQANALGFSWLVKTPQLGDEPPRACHTFPAETPLPSGRPRHPPPATRSPLPAYWMVEPTTGLTG